MLFFDSHAGAKQACRVLLRAEFGIHGSRDSEERMGKSTTTSETDLPAGLLDVILAGFCYDCMAFPVSLSLRTHRCRFVVDHAEKA